MAAFSQAFRVTAGHEWLSVSFLKEEPAISWKTRRQFCLCVCPPPQASTLVGWSNLHPTDVPRALGREGRAGMYIIGTGLCFFPLQMPGLKAWTSSAGSVLVYVAAGGWHWCGWLSAAPTVGLDFKQSQSLVSWETKKPTTQKKKKKKGDFLILLSRDLPWLLCKAEGFLLTPCQNRQDPLSDGHLGGTFRRTHVLLVWISALFPFLLPFLKLIMRGNFQANYGHVIFLVPIWKLLFKQVGA